ncbi:MAG: hypothetical protein L0H79_01505 [Intrasporangium sp.]|uniref:hypothetical protein n=1 Tax=Intrasporangium sp. TaxID=1925024 RepID=UPI0026484AD8|nr:hypothetical protein [Intrasporangium sp.]MDN5794412.1 hypothetical protein [Intrasporangium sp.]
MPIVYIHGVAIREDDETLAKAAKRFREVPWPTIASLLREYVAPVLADDAAGVPIMRVYWGDLGARFAWGGRSLVSRPLDEELAATPELSRGMRSRATRVLRETSRRTIRGTVAAIRRPVEDFLPTFIGDVLTYVAGRGTAAAPGSIPQRVLAGLEAAAATAASREEPLVVVTHSMGGQILYDALTHFIPRTPRLRHIRVDFWCALGSQVGFFEELGLFLESGPSHGEEAGLLTPCPSPEQLGGWWNVWDYADLLSFRAGGIFDGVDDTPFFAAGTLATDHNHYLDHPEVYRTLAEKVRVSLESDPGARWWRTNVEDRQPRSTQE